MENPIKIAVDAMGGDNSPVKIIEGIEIHNSVSNNIFYNIFGNQTLIYPLIKILKFKKKIINYSYRVKLKIQIVLYQQQKKEDTSMWLSIESLKLMSQMQ